MQNIKSSINVIKSGVGNIGSIVRVLEDLDYEYKIVNKPQDFSNTKKIILPGVGSYDSFINSLIQNKLLEEIKYLVLKEKYSILGICVGMQSFFVNSEEGSSKGFGFIDDKCKKFKNNNKKVPHIGWNKVNIKKKVIYLVILKITIFILLIVMLYLKLIKNLQLQLQIILKILLQQFHKIISMECSFIQRKVLIKVNKL